MKMRKEIERRNLFWKRDRRVPSFSSDRFIASLAPPSRLTSAEQMQSFFKKYQGPRISQRVSQGWDKSTKK